MPAKLEPAPYWTKNPDLQKIKDNLTWNFPEQKQGTVSILGGNREAFATEVKIADYLAKYFPMIKTIKNHFPDALKSKLPLLENLFFYPSTETGSFAPSNELASSLAGSDFAIVSGDLSKNSLTTIAISNLLQSSADCPIILTRDAIDLVRDEAASFIEHKNLFLIASLAQIQKLLRALFFTRPLLLSSPIFPVVETLHKFTLSYSTAILTFHDGKIICAHNGQIVTIDLAKTRFTPLSLWSGELAANLAVYQMFNKTQKLQSMLAAVL